MIQPVFITVREAAAALNVGPVAVLDLIDAGLVSGAEVHGKQLVDSASLAAYADLMTGASQ